MAREKNKQGQQVDNNSGEVFEDAETGNALIATSSGALQAASMDDLFDAGFESVKTIKVGDPENGCIPAYFGEVVGPGEAVSSSIPGPDGKPIISSIPTWQVRPAKAEKLGDGSVRITATKAAVHNLVTPYQLNADLANLYKVAKAAGGRGLFAVRWNRKKSIKGGARVVNDFDFMQQIKTDGDVAEAATA